MQQNGARVGVNAQAVHTLPPSNYETPITHRSGKAGELRVKRAPASVPCRQGAAAVGKNKF